MMLRRVNICSVHERPFLNPACSSRRVQSQYTEHEVQSTASYSLFSCTLLKTLPSVESNVIPRQLLQSMRLPFFGSLIITPFFQSSATSKSCHIMLNSSANCSATVSLPWASQLISHPRLVPTATDCTLDFFKVDVSLVDLEGVPHNSVPEVWCGQGFGLVQHLFKVLFPP